VRAFKAGDRPISLALKFFPSHRSGSGFVQSGFNEVALTPALRAPPCHATSQNPPDFQIRWVLIQDAGWMEASKDGPNSDEHALPGPRLLSKVRIGS